MSGILRTPDGRELHAVVTRQTAEPSGSPQGSDASVSESRFVFDLFGFRMTLSVYHRYQTQEVCHE
jgi:hypothetical protein